MILPRLFAGLRVARLSLRSTAIRTYLRLAFPGIECHGSVRFGRGATVQAFDGGTIELRAGAFVHDRACLIASGGRIVVGERVAVGRGSVIVACAAIELGAGTLIAEYVTVRDQDHAHGGAARLDDQGLVAEPVTIGEDVWLGAKVSVTKGVTIAARSVIGANAVVTRSLPEQGVYGGVPAKLLRQG